MRHSGLNFAMKQKLEVLNQYVDRDKLIKILIREIDKIPVDIVFFIHT